MHSYKQIEYSIPPTTEIGNRKVVMEHICYIVLYSIYHTHTGYNGALAKGRAALLAHCRGMHGPTQLVALLYAAAAASPVLNSCISGTLFVRNF